MNEINAEAKAAQAKVFELRDALHALFSTRATADTLRRFDALRADLELAETKALRLADAAMASKIWDPLELSLR